MCTWSVYYIVMNWLDPIKELYDMYSEEEDTPRIVELGENGLDFVLDVVTPDTKIQLKSNIGRLITMS